VRRIVLLFGSGIDAKPSGSLTSESSQLTELLAQATAPIEVSVISLGLTRSIPGTVEHVRLEAAPLSIADRMLTMIGAFGLRTRFATFPLGRLLNSLGPVDQGRVFWRAVRRHPEAMRVLAAADIALATDLTSTKTAWIAVHRGWVNHAYYDHRSASLAAVEHAAGSH
jgi:hypothetical protein